MSTPPNTQLVQQKRSVSDLLNSEKAKLEIGRVLPKHLTPERMTRVALTAALKNPALLNCKPESLMNALLVCSQAGLEPDGRLAHLIPFGDQVQVIFDYKGLVTLALRNGMESVYADKVCENDEFVARVEDGNKKLCHQVNWRGKRGDPYCYYAVCKRNGEPDYEIMTMEEIVAIKNRSRASKSGPWITDFDEMAKKTVLRRMSKRWDLLPEIRDVINADDDTPPPVGTVTTSRPIFEVQAQIGDPEHEPATPEPEPITPEPAKEQKKPANSVQTVRNLCRSEKIKEPVLLGFLVEIGLIDEALDSLEAVQLQKPSALETVIHQWSDMAQRINEATKG